MSNIYDAQIATRNPAWYRLGANVADEMTSADALRAANLGGWDVRKEAMFTASGIEIPNRVATVRTDPTTGGTEYLGYVGHNYVIQQNEDTFGFLDTLADVSGAHYDTAGYFGRGHKVFMTMKLPEGIKVGGQDAHDLYILATNGHDGFNAFQINIIPIRLMCTNQITMAVRNALRSFKIRHTTNMAGRISEARNALEMTFEYMTELDAELNRMLDTEYTNAEFERLTESIFPDAKTAGGQDKVTERRGVLYDLWATAETNEFGRGTKYAAYNAVTEYADWYAPVRGEDADGTKRALRAMTTDTVQDFKDFALASLRAA